MIFGIAPRGATGNFKGDAPLTGGSKWASTSASHPGYPCLRTSPVMTATSAICLIPIHSPPISVQPIEKVHALSLMGKRAHSDADIRGSRRHRARRPNKNGLMGTSAVCRRSVVEFSAGNGAPEEIRTPDPQIRSLVLYAAAQKRSSTMTAHKYKSMHFKRS